MQIPKFKKNNKGFKCKNCEAEVKPHPTSSRDHCNFCLYGEHVDINPGDRMNECKGMLKPVGLKIKTDKEQIVYKCEKCTAVVNCIVAPDDNREIIIELSSKAYE